MAGSHDEEKPLMLDSDNFPTQSPNNYGRDVHILSCSFLLIFLAYGAAQNLETTINTTDDLGSTSLGILYLSFTFFSLLASIVVRFLGSKNALVLGTTGYWLFIAANLYPTWYTMVPASVYLGFSASIIWVGQGTYLTSTAHSHATEGKLHEGTVIGSFNGEFWGMFASHQFVGNLISLGLLSNGTDGGASGTTLLFTVFLCIMSVGTFVGNLISLGLLSNGTDGGTSGTNLLFTVFLCIMSVGTVLMCFLKRRDGNGDGETTPTVSFASLSKSVIKPMLDVRMLLIIPLIAYSGLQQAFVWAEFTKNIVTPAIGVSGVGGAMAVYGAFDALCSVAAGRLTKGLQSITWIVSAGTIIHAVVLIWLLLKDSVTSGVLGIIYPLVMAALLGIGDGVFMTQLNALLGILFKHDMEGAFAQLKVWQSASIALVFFIEPYISLQVMLVIMFVALSVAYGGLLFLTLGVEKAFSSTTSNSSF